MGHFQVIHVQEPWFSYISSGEKIIEGRKNTSKWKNLNPGDVVIFLSDYQQQVSARIVDIRKYLTLRNTLSGINTIEKGMRVYTQFWSLQEIEENGMLAIEIELM